jgi:hypothetical protein
MNDSRIVPLAFPWPATFALLAFVVLAASLGGDFIGAMKEGGIYAWLLLPLALFACAASSGVVGAGLPRALAIGLAAVPWIAGVGAAAINMSKVLAAIASVDVAEQLEILGEGTAEVLVTRIIGAAWSAGAFLGLTLSFALRATAGSFAAQNANAGAGRDGGASPPRKPKDGASAFIGAGFAFAAFGLALTSLLSALALRFGLHVSTVASPADRATIIAAACAAMAQVKVFGAGLVVVGVLAAIAALAVARTKLIDAVVAALILPIVFVADDAPLAEARAHATAASIRPWSNVAGFAPAHFVGGGPPRVIEVYTTTGPSLTTPAGKVLAAPHEVADEEQLNQPSTQGQRDLVVGLHEKASVSSLDLAVHAAVLLMQEHVLFVAAGEAGPVKDAVKDPLLLALVAPAVSGREVDVPCDAADVVAHIDGLRAAIDAHPARVCLALTAADDGAHLASALDELASAGVHVALGPPPLPPDQQIHAITNDLRDLLPPGTHIPGLSVSDPGDGKSNIQRVVESHRSEVQSCYERALLKNPSAQGRVMLTFTVGVDGTVTDATGGADAVLAEAGVERCIAERAKTWRFAKRAAPTTVKFPFVLRSAE